MKTVVRLALVLLYLAGGLYGLVRAVSLPVPGSPGADRVDGGAWSYAWLPTLAHALIFLAAGLAAFRFGRRLLEDDSVRTRITVALFALAGLFAVRGIVQWIAGGPPPYAVFAPWGWLQYVPSLAATLGIAVAAVAGAGMLAARKALGFWILLALFGLGALSVTAEVLATLVDPNLRGSVPRVAGLLVALVSLLGMFWYLRSDLDDEAPATPSASSTSLGL